MIIYYNNCMRVSFNRYNWWRKTTNVYLLKWLISSGLQFCEILQSTTFSYHAGCAFCMLLVDLINKFIQSLNIRNSIMNFSIRCMALKKNECSLINAKDFDLSIFPSSTGNIPDSLGSSSWITLYTWRFRDLTDNKSALSVGTMYALVTIGRISPVLDLT